MCAPQYKLDRKLKFTETHSGAVGGSGAREGVGGRNVLDARRYLARTPSPRTRRRPARAHPHAHAPGPTIGGRFHIFRLGHSTAVRARRFFSLLPTHSHSLTVPRSLPFCRQRPGVRGALLLPFRARRHKNLLPFAGPLITITPRFILFYYQRLTSLLLHPAYPTYIFCAIKKTGPTTQGDRTSGVD